MSVRPCVVQHTAVVLVLSTGLYIAGSGSRIARTGGNLPFHCKTNSVSVRCSYELPNIHPDSAIYSLQSQRRGVYAIYDPMRHL